MVLIISREYY